MWDVALTYPLKTCDRVLVESFMDVLSIKKSQCIINAAFSVRHQEKGLTVLFYLVFFEYGILILPFGDLGPRGVET